MSSSSSSSSSSALIPCGRNSCVFLNHDLQNSDPSLLTTYSAHKGAVTSLKFRPFMKHLVSGGSDGSILMWSLFCRPNLARQTQVRPYRFLGHQGEICAVAVSPLDTVVASASKDKTVRLWIPTAEGRSSVIRAHSSTIRTVAFSPDGECLLTGSDDKSLKIWDVETEKFLQSLNGHMNWVRSAEFNSNGRQVVSGGDDKTVRLWDVERHECVHVFSDVPGMVTCTRFHPNGSCIGSSGSDQAVQIWDIRSKMLIQHYAGNAGAVKSLCFHPAGNFLLSTCDDATLKIWDLREGQILYTIKGHEGATTCAEFSPTGDHFASGSQDEHVMLWQSNIKQPRRQLYPGIIKRDLACTVLNSNPNQETDLTTPQSKFSHKDTNRSQDTVAHMKLESSSSVMIKDSIGNGTKRVNATVTPMLNPCSNSTEKAASNGGQFENTSGSCQAASQDMGITLERLVSQLDTLTRTISLFGERLSHTEDKVLRLEKLGSTHQSTVISEENEAMSS